MHVTQPGSAGVARVVLELATWQAAQGHEVTVAGPSDSWLAAELKAREIVLHHWNARRGPGLSTWREVRELQRIIQTETPSILHLHSTKAGLAGRLAVKGRTPTIYQPHAWGDWAAPASWRFLVRRWERTASRWTCLTLCLSRDELAHSDSLSISSSRLVRNGVDATKFQPRDRRDARERLGIKSDARMVLCVGRLTKQKGQIDFLEIWKQIEEETPNVLLVLLGQGPDKRVLEASSDGYTVRFVTDCEDPRDWYAACDIVVAPSHWEGAALVPLEALAMGRTIVGYDVGDLGHIISIHGVAVPAGMKELLHHELRRVVTDPALQAQREIGATDHVRRTHQSTDRFDEITNLYTNFAGK
ncbi:glycosyltransferase family 4 protein [Flavimobilis soli]|nr:glycosyltransferase family 4 protein [Flavimobilis soli]